MSKKQLKEEIVIALQGKNVICPICESDDTYKVNIPPTEGWNTRCNNCGEMFDRYDPQN